MVTRLQRVVLSFTALSLSVCGGETHEKLAPPATIQNPTQESELTTLTLQPEAVRRIGIATAAVEERSVHRTRTLGGELLVPAGAAITVAAPRAGTIIAPAGAEPPRTGERVTHGQPLYRLVLLPSESDLLRTREEFLVQKARLENARAKARRAEELLGQSVGSIEAHEDAQAELIQSQAALEAARARLAMLDGRVGGKDVPALAPLLVQAPQDGLIRRVYVGERQTVAEGDPIFEVIDIDPLWVRVPVYVGDLESIRTEAHASVGSLAGSNPGVAHEVRPVSAPPSADPRSSSVDLFYELVNPDSGFRPGQRVGVTLLLRDEEQGLVVPWSAIVYDIHGGTWVYERIGAVVFARRRVELRRVVGSDAILARGPAAGTQVVTTGAAELFSTEFGPAK